jgi:hypothetical protein
MLITKKTIPKIIKPCLIIIIFSILSGIVIYTINSIKYNYSSNVEKASRYVVFPDFIESLVTAFIIVFIMSLAYYLLSMFDGFKKIKWQFKGLIILCVGFVFLSLLTLATVINSSISIKNLINYFLNFGINLLIPYVDRLLSFHKLKEE